MKTLKVPTDNGWRSFFDEQIKQEYFQKIIAFLANEIALQKIIYPAEQDIFKAFEYTPFEKTKVVLLGQDPYHNSGQAMGLSFSVKNGTALPPSLVNIFKELKNDLGVENSINGELSHWAKQGVLLLNAALTVEENKPMSHSQIGWQQLTDSVIQKLSDKRENLVFILWGKFAQSKKNLIDETKHLILQTVHPSPLSAYRGFFGCGHFSKTNQYLKEHKIEEIDWDLTSEKSK